MRALVRAMTRAIYLECRLRLTRRFVSTDAPVNDRTIFCQVKRFHGSYSRACPCLLGEATRELECRHGARSTDTLHRMPSLRTQGAARSGVPATARGREIPLYAVPQPGCRHHQDVEHGRFVIRAHRELPERETLAGLVRFSSGDSSGSGTPRARRTRRAFRRGGRNAPRPPAIRTRHCRVRANRRASPAPRPAWGWAE
jgi:hypothetical protein